MPWNQPLRKLSVHMMGMLLSTPGTRPNARQIMALSSRPMVAKYLGLLRSETLPITNLLKP